MNLLHLTRVSANVPSGTSRFMEALLLEYFGMEESEEQFSTDPKVAQRIAKEVLLTQELLRERLEYDP